MNAFGSNPNSSSSVWCKDCKVMVQRENLKMHKCSSNQCSACRHVFTTAEELKEHRLMICWQKCPDCNSHYLNKACLAAHQCNG